MKFASMHRQAGMSFYQWLIVGVVVGFLGVIAVKLGPIYLKNVTVRTTVKDMQADREIASKSITEIRNAIARRFDVNRIEDIQALCHNKLKPCVKIDKADGKLLIDANYEARVHVMFNVDAVVVFSDNVVEIPLPGGR